MYKAKAELPSLGDGDGATVLGQVSQHRCRPQSAVLENYALALYAYAANSVRRCCSGLEWIARGRVNCHCVMWLLVIFLIENPF